MKDKIKRFLKSNLSWKQIISTIVATFLISLIIFIYGLLSGLDWLSSFKQIWVILTTEVRFIWLIILLLFIFIYIKLSIKKLSEQIKSEYLTKKEIQDSLNKKLDKYTYDCFIDQRFDPLDLKNHPLHGINLYMAIGRFKNIIEDGIKNHDDKKVDNGIIGLINEIKEDGRISGQEKSEIINLLNDCYKEKYNAHKDDLINLINKTEIN